MQTLQEELLFSRLRESYPAAVFEKINKGWSCDIKYCMTLPNGTRYLLRATPEEKSASREEMFRMQQKTAALGVPMCAPVEFGRWEQGTYTVQTWIDGEDAEQVIPRLSLTEQYAHGLEAGRILRKIHSIPAPENQPDWEPRFNKKMDRKIKMYRECPISFEGAEDIIAFIEENRHLLAGRPQSFQHGDYHIGNMMIEKGKLIIIDFDRYDFGDPWEEFNRIVWCAQASPRFASGMVDGYFGGDVPMEFWKLLTLYISSNLLSSVPWAIPFGEKEVRTMLDQAKEVLGWYDNMKKVVPAWYCANREYVIEKLSLDEYEKCGNIWNMAKSPHTERFRREIAADNRIVYIYKVNGEFIAECALVLDRNDPDYTIPGKRIYLSRLVVKKNCRNQGIGSRLLEFVLQKAEEMGYPEISVGVDKDNDRALHLYQKYGFDEILFEGEDEAGEYYKLLKKF